MSAALPAGYEMRRERGVWIAALPSVIGAVRAAVAEHGSLHVWAARRREAQRLAGRGAAWAVETEDGGWVVRHYRRGGAVARVLGDRYLRLGATRPLRELVASAHARERGVATPQVVAVVSYWAGAFYRADIATRFIDDSTDLATAVLGPKRLDDAGRISAWRAAGALLQSAFAAGVVHRDLNLRNILVQRTPAGMTGWLIDLDRATVGDAAVGAARRAGMLARLHRSRRKIETQTGDHVAAAELAAFTAHAGDPHVTSSPSSVRRT